MMFNRLNAAVRDVSEAHRERLIGRDLNPGHLYFGMPCGTSRRAMCLFTCCLATICFLDALQHDKKGRVTEKQITMPYNNCIMVLIPAIYSSGIVAGGGTSTTGGIVYAG